MLTSILGARLNWYQADGWVFDPVTVGPDIIEYTLAKGPHAGRHAIQHFYYERVAPGVETTVWYEESGALVHITWYLETQTTHRFAALPAWLAKDMTVYRGDNQDPAFIEKIRKLISQQQDWPRHILNDDGYFIVPCRKAWAVIIAEHANKTEYATESDRCRSTLPVLPSLP